MDVSIVNTGSGYQSKAREAKSEANALGYESFLHLLVTQMKNQDPTAPMESTEYMSQLASFSQVEQQTQTNKKLDSLLSASALSKAEAFIGRTISSADGSVKGVVESVRVFDDGVIAKTTDGKEITLGSGIVIS